MNSLSALARLALAVPSVLAASPTDSFPTYFLIDLATISPYQAGLLEGHIVRTTFAIGLPEGTTETATVVGPGSDSDSIERAAYLPPNDRFRVGQVVTVEGWVSVKRYPAAIAQRPSEAGEVKTRTKSETVFALFFDLSKR